MLTGSDAYDLYLSSPSTTQFLDTLSAENFPKILFAVHNGWYGSHIGGRSLALKITRTGFFWPTLSKDAMMYVKTCDACHKLSIIAQKLAATLTLVISPIPLVM
ncbi:hypothetical protein LIER_10868 [Lithospermum erythrorhizon]|uniref:Integrase zinc-binding domain-containing protein n=1 Tax=Lithospermum erythrorhizon TaxID=34254 RepID=A0AAV3PR04_LITER